jgi:hypothetical protein
MEQDLLTQIWQLKPIHQIDNGNDSATATEH